jgi:predicted amidohydrolase
VLLLCLSPLGSSLASAQAGSEPPTHIQLVAVQMRLELDDYWTREAFERRIRAEMDAVASATDPALPTLVVFPEDVGLMLVVQGMERRLAGIDSIATAIETAVRASTVPLLWTRLIRRTSWVPALLLRKNRQIAETYFEVFSAAARDYGVYLVAGSVPLPPYRIEDGEVLWQRGPLRYRVHNTSYLFGPDGSVIGKQDKVELIELEREAALSLEPGSLDDLRVYDTPLGRIGIAICLDAFDPEVVDRLTELGAQVLVQPSANPAPWDEWQQGDWLRGSHRQTAVDGRFAYAVNPMLTGPLWDIAFYGQSAIFARGAPNEGLGYASLDPMDGFVAVAGSDDGEEVLVAVVPHPDLVDPDGGASTP